MFIKVRSMKFIALLTFLVSLSFATSNCYALTCSQLLNHFSNKSSISKIDAEFSARVSTKISDATSAEELIGRQLSIEEIFGFVGSKLPKEFQESFLAKLSERFSGLSIETTDRPIQEVGLKYRNRIVNYRVNRSRAATLRWSDRKVNSREELFELVDRTIDVWAETSFLPIRMSSIYRSSKQSFVEGNTEAIKDKILLKLFTLREEVKIPSSGPFRSAWNKTKSLLRSLLPLHFSEIRSAKLTEEHLRVYEESGPQGVYELIRRQHGLGLAVKYWFTHLANAKVALFSVYTAFMAPQMIYTYDFIVNEQSIQVTDLNYGAAYRLLEVMRSPPDKLLLEVEGHLLTLPESDRKLIENFINDAKFEFNPPEQQSP